MTDIIAAHGFLRDYRDRGIQTDTTCICCPDGEHRAYQAVLHDRDDRRLDWQEAVRNVLRSLPEGRVVEIVVRDTGEESSLSAVPWVLVAPHKYGPAAAADQ